MNVTFRAEIMPNIPRDKRTFRISEVLPNERVRLDGFDGEFREAAFEPLNFQKAKTNE
jgi:hypothetical protein